MQKSEWKKEEYHDYARSMFDPSKVREKPELLKGVRVLEVATALNGPMVSCFMAELGAEVIKFELPPGNRQNLPMGGDTIRYAGSRKHEIKGSNLITFTTARNKYHVTLDITTQKGQEIFKKFALMPDTDVILENLRAGAMDKWGLGYRHLNKENPRLIYLATNGPGQWGPKADMISYDLLAQAYGGKLYATGFPEDDPKYPGIPTQSLGIGDTVGAIWGFAAIMAALYYREKTGEGQFIEFSQIEGLIRISDYTLVRYSVFKDIFERRGNKNYVVAPYYVTKCSDGYVIIGCGSNKIFHNLCEAMGKPELKNDPRFLNNYERVENQEELMATIDTWISQYTRDELREIADRYSFVCAPVMNAKDICQEPHYRARGSVIDFDDPYYGKMTVSPLPIRFSKTPPRIKTVAKPIGADNEYIYGKYLGLTGGDLEGLKGEKII